MRPSGLEPPPCLHRTRPSTLRVYQFRHRRRAGEYIRGRAAESGAGEASSRAASMPCLASVHVGATVRTHVRSRPPSTRAGSRADMDLTKRQQEIFDFIRKYSAKYGYPPTVRDIGKAVGLASSSTVHAHLANLEKLGLLRRDPSKPRAIELLDRAVGSAVDSVRGIVRAEGLPLLGSVAAGQPMLAEENIEDYVSVPEIAGGGEGEYLLRIRGDSMKDAGILEGDFVVVRPQDTAQRRRRRGRAARRGGDGQALLPRGRPHSPAARERDDGADSQQGGQGARSCRRLAQERLTARRPGAERARRLRRSVRRAGLSRWRHRATLTVQVRQPRRREPSRKVRTSQGRVVEISTRGNPRESATETNRLRPPSHVNGGPARVKWCGKSAPASRRRGGWANPTRCKAKQDRLQVARQGPGRPHRWMAAQRQNPAYRPAKEKPRSGGVFLLVESLGS